MTGGGRRRAAAGVLVLAVGVAAGACGGEPRIVVEGDLAFVGVNVLPMDAERVLEHRTVVIEDGRIVSIYPAGRVEPAEGVEVVEAEGHYLMPGLTEMHGHLPSPRMSDEDIRNLLFLYLANGVTTVRGMQGDPSQFDLRASIERGRLLGPHLYLASVSMSGARVTTPEEAEQLARRYRADGYDLIKTHEGLSPEVFAALAATAAEVGIPFGGHVSGLRRPAAGARAGPGVRRPSGQLRRSAGPRGHAAGRRARAGPPPVRSSTGWTSR